MRTLPGPGNMPYTAFQSRNATREGSREKGNAMSRVMSYVAVGVVAFLVGGLSFWLVSHANERTAELKSAEAREHGGEATTAASRQFSIEGMSCQGCVDSITSALAQIPGVQSAKVSLQDGTAVVMAKESEVPTERIVAAIAAAGYKGQLATAQGELSTATTSGPQPIPEMEKSIVMQPIGIVHSPYKEAKGTPIQGVFDKNAEAWVELRDEYVKGLKDLDGFSHAILLYHFHLSDRVEIVGKPYLENEDHGIFAMRSPHRPNHIGLSVVRIKKIETKRLFFGEVDVLNGTPVLDIKPYVKQFDSRPDAVSGWIERHYKDGKSPEHQTAK